MKTLVTLQHFVFAFSISLALCCRIFGQSKSELVLGQGKSWQTPIYLNDSGIDGPTVIVTGGIHGNEPAGARAADQIRYWPIVRGKLIVIPRVNTAALTVGKRFTPKASKNQRDLNRNFPSPGTAEIPRGEIATELWEFVVKQNPDWLFDLHEGFDFNISHQPKQGKEKSVGSTIIFDRTQQLDEITNRMLATANNLVKDPKRKFLLRGLGPKKTTLASAVIKVLGKNAMILETTYRHQRLPVRTRQHRAMVSAALHQLEMIPDDCIDVLSPPVDKRKGMIFVGLYDDEGGSVRGVSNLTKGFDGATDITVSHLGAQDIRSNILSQFDVIVVGGGSGSKEAATIGKRGAAAIKRFVEDGGGYVGVCAGAYLCSAHYS